MSVQTFSTISQEKGNTSPQRETFLLWDRKAASHIHAKRRVIEIWIAVGLILAFLPMGMKTSVDMTIYMFFSQFQF